MVLVLGMMTNRPGWPMVMPVAATIAIVAALSIWIWWGERADQTVQMRVPGTDLPPGSESAVTNPVFSGKLTLGNGQPADLPGSWPGFRGPNRDNICPDPTPLARAWGETGPRELWGIDVGEGYAGPVVLKGRVYVMDYDQEKREDALRCLSLADGKEIWRYAYPVSVKRNHGMSRAVPAAKEKHVRSSRLWWTGFCAMAGKSASLAGAGSARLCARPTAHRRCRWAHQFGRCVFTPEHSAPARRSGTFGLGLALSRASEVWPVGRGMFVESDVWRGVDVA